MRFPAVLIACCAIASGQADEYNAIYRGEAGNVFSRKPNAFLVEAAQHRKPGKALDAGMGQGRNSIYLARQGWDVTGFDPADEGVRRAKLAATRAGVKLTAIVTSFEEFEFGENEWDLIVLTYEPTKMIAPKVERALKPGGAVVIEDRHSDSRRIWPAGGTFGNNELPSLFPGLRVLRYEDVWGRPDWSAEPLNARLVRLLAEKPLPPERGCVWHGKQVDEGAAVCWGVVTFTCRPDGWQISREKCSGTPETRQGRTIR
jgi:SAM-dependent methyltransferase